ncbi:Sterol-binding domain protein [Caldalkalibacillus thermarum TA2.A1]|uniref:SCP2 sterol-binding domain-containing protein n=1 Tax=Caldalkalibacillus thermarum (strain TA2.A1) TaxID=986075 RepID=F5L980_CALTT|nr:SCP2 sterol-binding domain-containing protein [Caldalkalibacillus thermarum]EGL82102.1 Sterol-binding domain protein [Caldalkalibacillus thermarum TA2.A1]QZT34933.1 SCP2 sterol-binding domain-containing protein [Caldalkalibacillus thermarum TA2.A1]
MSVYAVLESVVQRANQSPETLAGLNTVYQFNVSGQSYQVKVENKKAVLAEGCPYQPNCTVQLSDQTFHQLMNGQLNPVTAFMTGKLKIQGDMSQAMKLQNLLKSRL